MFVTKSPKASELCTNPEIAWAMTNKPNSVSLFCHQKHATWIIYDKDRFAHETFL